MVNLFLLLNLIRPYLQVLRSDLNVKNADTELQQRAIEYLQLSSIATQDVLATGMLSHIETCNITVVFYSSAIFIFLEKLVC